MSSHQTPEMSSGLGILQTYYDDSDSDDSVEGGTEEAEVHEKSSLPIPRTKCDASAFLNYSEPEELEVPLKRPRLLLSYEHDIDQEDGRACVTSSSIRPNQDSLNARVNETDAPSGRPLALPRVPLDILKMFPDAEENKVEDDQSQHEGRKRSFPHVRGNWASYVYIHFDENTEVVTEINKLIFDANESLSLNQSLYLINDKHLSLSRTLSFRHHWIEPFTSNLNKAVGSYQSFQLYFNEFDVYTNEEKSRTFISMKAIGTKNLLDIVDKCDEALSEFQLESYYKDPSFHVSCAWMLGDQSSWIKENFLPILNKKWTESLKNDPDLQFYLITSIEFKTGNKLHRFFLRN